MKEKPAPSKPNCLNTSFPIWKVFKKSNFPSSSKPSYNMKIHNLKSNIIQKLNNGIPLLMFLLSALGTLNWGTLALNSLCLINISDFFLFCLQTRCGSFKYYFSTYHKTALLNSLLHIGMTFLYMLWVFSLLRDMLISGQDFTGQDLYKAIHQMRISWNWKIASV